MSDIVLRHSLLLIDDDAALLQAFSDMLSFHFPNLDVTAVDSGVTALRELEKKRDYDVVICDLMMPAMDGVKTLAEIRKNHPGLIMYLMTGHPEPEEVFKDAGATGFIKKPLERAYFFDVMKQTIEMLSTVKRGRAKLSASKQKSKDVRRFLSERLAGRSLPHGRHSISSAHSERE